MQYWKHNLIDQVLSEFQDDIVSITYTPYNDTIEVLLPSFAKSEGVPDEFEAVHDALSGLVPPSVYSNVEEYANTLINIYWRSNAGRRVVRLVIQERDE